MQGTIVPPSKASLARKPHLAAPSRESIVKAPNGVGEPLAPTRPRSFCTICCRSLSSPTRATWIPELIR